MRSIAIPSKAIAIHSRKLLLSIHILTTVGALGAGLVLVMLGIAGLSGADPRTIYPAAHLVSAWLVAPLAVLSLATGLLLGLLTPWGLFRHWWVTIKLAITVILTGIVLFVLVPRLSAVAQTVITSGTLPTGGRALLVIDPALGSALLALNVFLAIFKPGGRLRRNNDAH